MGLPRQYLERPDFGSTSKRGDCRLGCKWPTNTTLNIYILQAYWCADGQMAKKSAYPLDMPEFGNHQTDDRGLGVVSWFCLGFVFIGFVAAVLALF